MNYAEWLSLWLANYVKPTTKSRTYVRYCQIVNTHILLKLGDYQLAELTPMLLQQFVSELLQRGNRRTGKGLLANSVNTVISVLQNSLKVASNLGYTNGYLANKICRPKIVEKQVSCFSLTEQKQIEQAVLNGKKPKLFGIVICLYTGLRLGELLALEWRDFDFTKSMMYITKTCYDARVEGKMKRIMETPKTVTSHRAIPLPKQLLAMIKELKRGTKSNFVIAEHDLPVSVRSYQRSFELLLIKLKLLHKGFHALRHTFATRALESGMDVKTLSEMG